MCSFPVVSIILFPFLFSSWKRFSSLFSKLIMEALIPCDGGGGNGSCGSVIDPWSHKRARLSTYLSVSYHKASFSSVFVMSHMSHPKPRCIKHMNLHCIAQIQIPREIYCHIYIGICHETN